ncbi:hypothetical protein QR680_004655 [Steinernema hermaphroditum]|uniref:Uncharacterized protein n=1 Tax=Steinernema hermaphroditum TaxID=289476 RepID=A0AA39HPD2_9BILA|nr:hypothetical protein QR680_004655 [Steinernema hermaphroditum]
MSIPNSQLPYSPPYNPQMATAPPPPGFVDRPIFSPPPPYTPPGAKLPGPTVEYYNSVGVVVHPYHYQNVESVSCRRFCCRNQRDPIYSAFCIVIVIIFVIVILSLRFSVHYQTPHRIEIAPVVYRREASCDCYEYCCYGPQSPEARRASCVVGLVCFLIVIIVLLIRAMTSRFY